MTRAHPFQIWKVAGLWLALMALVIKAALPTGYMLARDENRFVAIVLCSGQGAIEATIDSTTGEIVDPSLAHDANGAPAKDRQDAKSDPLCAFAAASFAAAPADFASFDAPLRAGRGAAASSRRGARAPAPRAGPPLPARGPPLYA